MATDTVSIFNMALSALGNSTEVQSDTENTPEANACRRYYEQARDETLQAFAWPFATTTVALALVENNPTTEWLYAYGYPSDCLQFGRILGDSRNETRDTRVPYAIRAGGLIYSDRPDAVGEYTQAITDTATFSPLFAKALSYKLAVYIAPRVTGGDPYQTGVRAERMYQGAIESARNSAVNEEQPDPLPESEFITARN